MAYLTKERLDEVIASLEKGYPLSASCNYVGISVVRLRKERHENPRVGIRVAEARLKGLDARAARLRARLAKLDEQKKQISAERDQLRQSAGLPSAFFDNYEV